MSSKYFLQASCVTALLCFIAGAIGNGRTPQGDAPFITIVRIIDRCGFLAKGRAGRRNHKSLSIYVAWDSPIDQYFMSHPDQLFQMPIEPCILNLANSDIVAPHLLCAASESALSEDDTQYFSPTPVVVHEALAAKSAASGPAPPVSAPQSRHCPVQSADTGVWPEHGLFRPYNKSHACANAILGAYLQNLTSRSPLPAFRRRLSTNGEGFGGERAPGAWVSGASGTA